MEDSEKNPLLANEEGTQGEKVVLPPPPYQPEQPKSDVPPHAYPTSMPLPTYNQSEKFEKEGVLDLSDDPILIQSDSESCYELDTTQPEVDNRGNCCEFIIFFLVTLLFSVVGFIFAICLATTAASQGGALAGLGVSFIAKPFLFEFYDKQYIQEYLYTNVCQGCSDVGKCQLYLLHALRLLFWFIGVIGSLLLYKGLSKFLSSRGRRGTTN